MTRLGIIGGIGPETTIVYYRKIVSAYLAGNPDGHYPPVIINSIDMTRMLDLIGDGQYEAVSGYLADEIGRLERAGASIAALASNTPHIVFDEVQALSPLPLVSIVEAARDRIVESGIERVALFGTRFTMQGGFYDRVFAASGIEIMTPDAANQDYIHDKYMSELVAGIVRDETRAELVRIARAMVQQNGVQGLVLGGTELSLILGADDVTEPALFDTADIHIERLLGLLD